MGSLPAAPHRRGLEMTRVFIPRNECTVTSGDCFRLGACQRECLRYRPRGRNKPYTAVGISRAECFRCGAKAAFQWQVCADRNRYRPLCADCDVALNKLVLEWMKDPEAEKKIAAYRISCTAGRHSEP